VGPQNPVGKEGCGYCPPSLERCVGDFL
jgi:hypothetical protein